MPGRLGSRVACFLRPLRGNKLSRTYRVYAPGGGVERALGCAALSFTMVCSDCTVTVQLLVMTLESGIR